MVERKKEDGEVWTLEALKEHFDSLRAMDAQALRLQAEEYERRLVNLNHENARIKLAAEKAIERSVYEIQHQSLIDRIVSLEADLQERRGKSRILGVAAGLFYSTLIALAAAATIWVSIFLRLK